MLKNVTVGKLDILLKRLIEKNKNLLVREIRIFSLKGLNTDFCAEIEFQTWEDINDSLEKEVL